MFLWTVRVLLAVIALGSAIGLSANLAGQSGASSSRSDTEWRFFGGDAGATRYSPANQITAENVRNLRVAWRWSARNFGPRPATTMQVSPLIVDGVMYTTAGSTAMSWHSTPPPANCCGTGARPETCCDGSTSSIRSREPPAAASPTGPTARATSGSSSSCPATCSWRSTRRPGGRCRASARTALWISPRTCGGTSGRDCLVTAGWPTPLPWPSSATSWWRRSRCTRAPRRTCPTRPSTNSGR